MGIPAHFDGLRGRFRLKGLREWKAKLVADIEGIGSKIDRETRAMTDPERTAFDKLKTDWVVASNAIRDVESDLQGLDDALNADEGQDGGGDPTAPPDPTQNSRVPGKENRGSFDGPQQRQHRGTSEVRALAFQGWCRKQHGMPLTDRQRAACRKMNVDPTDKEFRFQLRAQSVGTASAGGYTVAQGFSDALEIAMKDFSCVRGVVDSFRTDTGADFLWPTTDDTSNTGELLAENTEVAYLDVPFGSVTFKAWKFSSKGILVSSELLEDSAFNLEQILGEMMGERLGRAQGPYLTTGAGTTEPKGVVTCATAGLTTAGATAITGTELTRLAFSVDPAYRKGPKVGYMCHDSVVSYLLTLLDSTGRPLMRESFADGGRELVLNGFPVFVNQFMEPTVSNAPVTAKKHLLFGDFSRIKLRDVGDVRIKRLDERWAEKDQVGFIGFMRSDQGIVKSGAVKYLLQA